MPILTRGERTAIFQHILDHVADFQAGDTELLALSKQGINRLDQFTVLSPSDIDSWTYNEVDATTGNVTVKPLMLSPRSLLKHLLNWTNLIIAENGGDSPVLTEWQTYHNGHFLGYISLPRAPPVTPIATAAVTTPSGTFDFKKGNKRDMSVYPDLKDIVNFSTWKLSFVALATKDDLSNVLNETYKPSAGAAQDVFTLQQQFLFAVFTKTLKDPTAKDILRSHQHTGDAQKIYAQLCKSATKSAKAKLSKDDLAEFLTTAKLDSAWRGSHHGFLLHWCSQLRAYEELADSSELYSSRQKLNLLSKAVNKIPYLREIENTQDLLGVTSPTGHTSIDFATYLALLTRAAQRDDNIRSKSHNPKHRLSQHAITYDYVDHGGDMFADAWNETSFESNEHEIVFDNHNNNYYGETLHLLQHQTSVVPKPTGDNRNRSDRPHIPTELWSQLSEDVRLWYLGYSKAEIDSFKSKKKNPPPRKAQQHEHTAPAQVHFADPQDISKISSDQSESRDIILEQNKQEIERLLNSHSLTSTPQRATTNLPVHDTRRVLSTKLSTPTPTTQDSDSSDKILESDGKLYYRIKNHNVSYHVSELKRQKEASLVDRGANGGFAGEDVRVLEYCYPNRMADVAGIEDHTIKDLRIGTVAGLIQTQRGPIIGIMHQYAIYGKGKSIHSSPQLEHYGIKVDDRSLKVGGGQRITTLEGYVIPLQFRNGLAYFETKKPTDNDLEEYPHVILTSDTDWDPSILDNEIDLNEIHQSLSDLPPENVYGDIRFDIKGNYRGAYTAAQTIFTDSWQVSSSSYVNGELHHLPSDYNDFEDYVESCIKSVKQVHRLDWKTKPPDTQALRPYMLWQPPEVIKHTLDNTTQWGRHVPHETYKKAYKSLFPAANVRRRNEAVATDTIYSDTPAIDDGSTCAQLYVGLVSLYNSVTGMKSEKDFVHTLEDTIRKHGAMDKLISDRAQVEVSNKVLDILRAMFIGDWQSKPYNQHQNPAERRYQDVKKYTNVLLDRTGAPAYTWLLATMYVCFILNITSHESLQWKTPYQLLYGQTPDISEIFQFEFWEPVYFATGEQLDSSTKPSFPSTPHERSGRFVGFAEDVGDKFCYKVLTDDTQKIIFRSAIRSARDTPEINRRLSPPVGEPPDTEVVKLRDTGKDSTAPKQIIGQSFDPEDLIGRTYLMDPEENGERFRAKIVKKIIEREKEVQNGLHDIGKTKFLVSIEGSDKPDEIVDYNVVLDYVNAQMDDNLDPTEVFWKFKEIVGPCADYRGSTYNVMVA